MVSDDRGQLILIGSIAIALILVGLVLVVNTALFTEVVGSEGTVETTKEGGVATQELEDAVSAVAHNATVWQEIENDDVSDRVNDSLEPALANSSVDSRGAFVEVEYLDRNQTGTYVYQEDPARDFDEDFVPDGSSVDVGHFVLVIEDANDDMEIDVEGSGTNSETLEIDATAASAVDLSGANSSSACSDFDADGSVRIDLYNGRVYDAPGCTFDLFGPPEAPYEVETDDDGDDVFGTFQLVTDHANSVTFGASYATDPAIWSYDLAYEYDTDEVTVEGEREVNVYD